MPSESRIIGLLLAKDYEPWFRVLQAIADWIADTIQLERSKKWMLMCHKC